MPGFWETMKRLIAGQPVYQVSDETHGPEVKDQDSSDEPVAPKGDQQDEAIPPAPQVPEWRQHPRSGPKIYPEAVIERVESHVSDYDMELWVHIRNHALERVMLDKVLILDTAHELDHYLEPGEEREFEIYRGPMPTDRYKTRCELHYRDDSGDYFSAIHNVEFKDEEDKHYSVQRIRFLPPVKDI